MKKIICYFFILFNTFHLVAQNEREITVSEAKQQTIISEPITIQKGYLRLSSAFSYVFLSSDYYNSKWERTPIYSLQAKMLSFPFLMYYGLTNKLQIGISSDYTTNVVTYRTEFYDYAYNNTNIVKKYKTISRGLSNIVINPLYKCYDKNSLFMAVGTSLKVPIGKKYPTTNSDSSITYGTVSNGNYTLQGTFTAKKIFYPFSVIADFAYAYRFPTNTMIDNNEKVDVKFGNIIDFTTGLSYMLCDWITIQSLIEYRNSGTDDYKDKKYNYLEISTALVSVTPVLYFQIKNFRLSQCVSFTVLGKNTAITPMYALTASVKL